MREIKIPYPPGNDLSAVVFNPDTSMLWTAAGFSARPATELLIPLLDDGDEGMYVGDFPTGITAAGNYPIVARHTGTDSIAGVQTIQWNGSFATEPPTIVIGSLSTVEDADVYFGSRLYSEIWFAATPDKKQAALNDATRIINRFRYLGIKTEATQPFEWPRKGIYMCGVAVDSASVPQDILFAQYEIAFALLSGVNIEKELRSAGVTSRGYSSARITYDPGSTSVWLLLGVPSYVAWAYLLPYLYRETDGTIKLHRVS